MPVNNTLLGAVEAVPYPGRVLKVGVSAAETVKILQHRLNAVGCGPIAEDGVFDKANTERAVKLFQARSGCHGQSPRDRRGGRLADLGRAVRRLDGAVQFGGPLAA